MAAGPCLRKRHGPTDPLKEIRTKTHLKRFIGFLVKLFLNSNVPEREIAVNLPDDLKSVAAIQRWLEGSWLSTQYVSGREYLQRDTESCSRKLLPCHDGDLPRDIGEVKTTDAAFGAFKFNHPVPLSEHAWGAILDAQLCQC